MSKNLVNEEPDWGPEFAEIQEQTPLREKLEDQWQSFRVNGIYTFMTGLGAIAGAWSFRTQFSETSGISDSISPMAMFFVSAVAIGSVITLAGGLIFAIGQINLHRIYRHFDKAMAIILANEQK